MKMKRILLPAMLIAIAMPVAAMADGHKAKHYMKMLDANGDGQISAQEHADAAAKRFSKMDANGDGMLTKEEMKAAKKMKKKRKDKKEADND